MILADTSAWIEYDRATDGSVDRRLAELIDAAGPVAVTEPVVMESPPAGGCDHHAMRRLDLSGRSRPTQAAPE